MRADECEERRQKGAALGGGTFVNEVSELGKFHRKEAETEQRGHNQPCLSLSDFAFISSKHGKATGDR